MEKTCKVSAELNGKLGLRMNTNGFQELYILLQCQNKRDRTIKILPNVS